MKNRFINIFLPALSYFLIPSLALFGQKRDNRIFNDSLVKIAEIAVNSIHSDFGPCIIADSLYFTTYNDKFAKSSDNILKKKEFYDLYKAKIDKDGNPVSEREPVEAFITRFNDGPVSWCAKTGELFITQNDPNLTEKTKGFQKEIVRLKIVISKKVNGEWGPSVDFPYNSSRYSVGHPAINETGDTLLFTSDIPGGFGETDLYYSARKNGKWGLPVNLGPQVNTSGKDEFPFLTDPHLNGRFLLFSSNGRFGYGGFDLYYTKFPAGSVEINHFESPVNTSFDDFTMNIPVDAEYGYITSNRPGKGNDDIYKITFKRQEIPSVKTSDKPVKTVEIVRELYVFDQTTLRPVAGVKIISCDQQLLLTDSSGKVTLKAAPPVNCEVVATTLGYSDKKKILQSGGTGYSQFVRDTIWMNMMTDQKIVLHNIYYDFNSYEILPESANELDQLFSLMNQNPGMRVELSSHTDSRGSEVYNLRLSELRAKAAAQYLIAKGIKIERISWKGYGKTKLINLCNQPCTPAQQRENRRTELYIPGFIKGELVKQEKGDYSKEIKNAPQGTSDWNFTKEKKQETAEKRNVPAPKFEDKFKYFIILGSFTAKANAQNFLQQLKSEGFNPVILSEKEPVRVGIGYTLLSQAKLSLNDIRTQFKNAWIFIN